MTPSEVVEKLKVAGWTVTEDRPIGNGDRQLSVLSPEGQLRAAEAQANRVRYTDSEGFESHYPAQSYATYITVFASGRVYCSQEAWVALYAEGVAWLPVRKAKAGRGR